MATRGFWTGILSIFIVLSMCTPVLADIPPPIYGIDIIGYEYSLEQEAGTVVSYEAEVKNVGVLGLRDVTLYSERLPEGWFSSTDSTVLEFEETATLSYSLNIPEGESGLYAFSLIARGNYGVGGTAKIVPVVVSIVDRESTVETTTTTTEPEVPVISIPELSADFLKALDPEVVFSKFRSAVDYVRITAKSVLTDQAMLSSTIIALLVIVVVLVAVKKLAF